MIATSDRLNALQLIDQAVTAGARQHLACEMLGLSERTVQRWRYTSKDKRTDTIHPSPANKLSGEERATLLATINLPEYASLTPHQIVPKLADQGIYLASESSIYRIMKATGQGQRRGRSKPPQKRPLTTHQASGPNQVWCWDITWLPTTVKGKFFYWYMMKDIYSRKLVVNEVHENESSEHASHLLWRGCLRERIAGKPLVLHSDNGTAMRGANMLSAMHDLGVVPSFSRPRVSNDNAYAEALFKTAKYCPQWPERPFDTLEEARNWVTQFVDWYNEQHCHSALKYLTPGQRHRGESSALLTQRAQVYQLARQRHPLRWSEGTRNWKLNDSVYLNPEKAKAQEKDYMKAA